jgi:acetyl esterase/lipase
MRESLVVSVFSHWEKDNDFTTLARQTLPENITEITDIPYINDDETGHLLDIYYPDNMQGPFPVIIAIHGGGFLFGDKAKNKLFCYNLAKNGFIVFNLNYRLAFNGITVPDQIQDVIAALDWAGNNINNYPANMEKIYLVGESAGAYLAAMAALICESQRLREIFNVTKPNIKINALGLISGYMEMERTGIVYSNIRAMILEKGYKNQEYYQNLILKDLPEITSLPPVFLTTNEDDIIEKMSVYFKNILIENDIEHQYDYVRRSGRKLGHVFNVLNLDWEESEQLNNRMLEYLLAR